MTAAKSVKSVHLTILEHASVDPAEAALADEVPVAEHVGGLLHLLEREHHRAVALLRRRALLLGLPQLGRLVHPWRQRMLLRSSKFQLLRTCKLAHIQKAKKKGKKSLTWI